MRSRPRTYKVGDSSIPIISLKVAAPKSAVARRSLVPQGGRSPSAASSLPTQWTEIGTMRQMIDSQYQ